MKTLKELKKEWKTTRVQYGEVLTPSQAQELNNILAQINYIVDIEETKKKKDGK